MEFGIVYKQKRNLIIAQVIGVVLGLVLGITGEYDSFWEKVGSIFISPLSLAALFRFCVRTFQVIKIKLGTKVYDNNGGYMVIERPLRGAIAAVMIPFLLLGIISALPEMNEFLLSAICLLIIAIGAFFCYKDIRFFVNLKRKSNEQQER